MGESLADLPGRRLPPVSAWDEAAAVELLVAVAASEEVPAASADIDSEAVARAKDVEDVDAVPLETLPVVSYIDAVDPKSSAIYMSPRVERMLGYSPEEWGADPGLWTKVLHPDDRAAVLLRHAETNETGEPFSAEYRLLARDGRTVWVRDEAVLVRDEDGRPRFWEGVLIDISERKQRA